jgi:hypothetical protein
MIRIKPDGSFDARQVKEEIVRLETLAWSLRRLLRRGASLPGDHAEAAVLQGWEFALDQRLCLMTSSRETVSITDPLVLLDRPRGVVRTETSWYRLGPEA